MALGVGDLIDGKYQIVRVIGEGGMGVVYEGLNVRIHRRVAIKVLHASLATSGEVVARFEKEAQAAGRIGSRHIVEVLDLGNLDNGDRYIVMEYLEGESLGQRLAARKQLEPDELVPIVSQLLEGLAAAHSAGIVHRDLKPDNVYLQQSPRGEFVKLLDFGISKFNQLGNSEFSLTRTGSVMGSPYYMSPEQAKGGKQADHRVDLYAVGVILYEALSGKVPFDAESFNELLFKIALEEPRPLAELVPGLDPALVRVVHQAMAREPAERFQSAGEFQSALAAYTSRAREKATVQPVPERPVPSGASGSNRPVAFAGTAPGAWSQSSAGSPAAPKKPPYALVAALSVVLAGGATALFVKLRAGTPEAEAKAPASSAGLIATAQATPEPPVEVPAAPSAQEPEPPASGSASALTVTPAVPMAAPVRAVARPRAAVRPADVPETAPAPAPVPDAKGRKVRRDL